MYTSDVKLPENKTKSTNTKPQYPTKTVESRQIIAETISPNQKDSLFWCLYIIDSGYNEFQQITRNHRVRQIEIQSKVIEHIQKNKGIMKNTNMKFTNIAVQEVMSDLLTITKEINYQVAMSLCVLYNINVYMIDK